LVEDIIGQDKRMPLSAVGLPEGNALSLMGLQKETASHSGEAVGLGLLTLALLVI